MVLFGSSGPNSEYDLAPTSESLFSSFSWDNRSKPEKLEYVSNLTCRLSGLSISFTLENSLWWGVNFDSLQAWLFSWFRFINWFFLNGGLLYTGLCNWLKGGSSFTLAQTTSLFNRVCFDPVFDSGCPGFHLGSTYSGTFHTDGGGLGGSLSLPSDWDLCLKYCIVNTGGLGTLSGDLDVIVLSSFFVVFEVAVSLVLPESTLWSEICDKKINKQCNICTFRTKWIPF